MSDGSTGMRNYEVRVIHSDNGKSEQLLTKTKKQIISVEEVYRILDVGRLLFSVLTANEIEELRELLNSRKEE